MYANSSLSSLSLDQSNHSDSLNGKITRALLCFWCQMDTSLWNFGNAHKGYIYFASWGKTTVGTILPSLFCSRYNSSSCYFASWDKIFDFIYWRIRIGSEWWFSKILRIRTGSDSILSNQDWTHSKKFVSQLSVVYRSRSVRVDSGRCLNEYGK